MNKLFMLVVFVVLINGCDTSERVIEMCPKTSQETFDLLAKAISDNDLKAFNGLNDTPGLDTIFLTLKAPHLSFIPEGADGAFGKKEKGEFSLYYARLLDGTKEISVKAVMISEATDCHHIINIADVSSK